MYFASMILLQKLLFFGYSMLIPMLYETLLEGISVYPSMFMLDPHVNCF